MEGKKEINKKQQAKTKSIDRYPTQIHGPFNSGTNHYSTDFNSNNLWHSGQLLRASCAELQRRDAESVTIGTSFTI